jgi:tRNA-uridine 2-sulfurtransferase
VNPAPGIGEEVQVRIRHRAPLVTGELLRVDGDEIEIALHEPIAAIAPGQSLVVYDARGAVLGGGFIDRRRDDRTLAVIAA